MRKGYGINNLVAVGSSSQLSRLFYQFNRNNTAQINIVGYFAEQEVTSSFYSYLGGVDLLKETVQTERLDGILLAFDVSNHHKIIDILRLVEGKNIELFYIPDLLDLITSGKGSIEIGGMPVLQLKSVAFSGWQGFLKRSFDLLFSMIGLLLFCPIMMFISFLIKLSSPGPVLHLQRRVGLDGKEFTMIKFRSMSRDAEQESGPVWTEKNDPRVTPIGRFLRRTSLDELPQLVNVFMGEMSIVGPRPERHVFVEQFKEHIPQYSDRHRVRSGMTGWAQVNGLRGQSSIKDRTRFDIYYIENWSLGFDIKIIFMTFAAIFRGENAY
jgi:exopolysaccharide biosynthesis polyprenyl glycosylphosphotransferase